MIAIGNNCLKDKFRNYMEEYKKHLKNPIIKAFLNTPEHMHLLKEVIYNSTPLTRKKLDEAFKQFYFKIRFTSYLSQTIYFNAINYDKKTNLFSDRNQLILDKPVTEDEGVTLIDLLVSSNKRDEQEACVDSSKIEDHITNYLLYEAVQKLTENQRQLLSLAYIYGLSDSEIAVHLNKSQQAVSKSHKKALNKLRKIIENV